MTATSTLTVGGAELRVRRWSGEGRPLLLLHGASGSAASWGLTEAAWAGQEVWLPDLPGRGGSPGAPLARAEAVADWLAGLIQAAGLQRPLLVGHSFGGAVALQVALQHPGAVGGLALVASGGRLRVAPAILAAVAAATPEAPFRLDAAFGPSTAPAVVEAYAVATRAVPPATAAADWAACDAFDALARLGEVRCPSLVISGEDDVLTPPKRQRALAAALPGSTQVSLPNVGHMLPWEAPQALADAVRGWWAAQGA